MKILLNIKNKKTNTKEGIWNLRCWSPKLLCSGTMHCIDAFNARMLLWRGQLPPPRRRLTPPLLRWWNLHPPTGHRIQSLQNVLCLGRTTHWPQHMRSLQHICHLRDTIGSWTSSDIKMFLSTCAYGNREYSAGTNLKARLWIWFYRLLAYKELCTLLRWSTWAPFPFDPPSTLFKFLWGKCCPPLPFQFPINSGHVPDIRKQKKLISMS
jgi:hypothetical protein